MKPTTRPRARVISGFRPAVWNENPSVEELIVPRVGARGACVDCGTYNVDCGTPNDDRYYHGPRLWEYCSACCPRHPEWECAVCERERLTDPFKVALIRAIREAKQASPQPQQTSGPVDR